LVDFDALYWLRENTHLFTNLFKNILKEKKTKPLIKKINKNKKEIKYYEDS